MVNSAAKSWSGEGRWQRKFQGACLHCLEFPPKYSGCFLFLEMVLIYFFCNYQDIKIVSGNNQILITIYLLGINCLYLVS